MHTVELFEVYVGKTFARLYERFPVSTEIKVEDLVQGVDGGDIDKHMQHQIAGHTLMSHRSNARRVLSHDGKGQTQTG